MLRSPVEPVLSGARNMAGVEKQLHINTQTVEAARLQSAGVSHFVVIRSVQKFQLSLRLFMTTVVNLFGLLGVGPT